MRDHLRAKIGSVKISQPPLNGRCDRPTVYHQLLDAIARRRAVRIRYRKSKSNEDTSTKLSPYWLWFTRPAWYVIGRSSVHRAVRTFNLGRIVELELLDDTFVIPSGFTVGRYLRNAWRMIPERGKTPRS
jgi:predicted DNA-binding transcriptional regulator YafY